MKVSSEFDFAENLESEEVEHFIAGNKLSGQGGRVFIAGNKISEIVGRRRLPSTPPSRRMTSGQAMSQLVGGFISNLLATGHNAPNSAVPFSLAKRVRRILGMNRAVAVADM